MAKIDENKEEIGAIKTYLGFIVAFIITTSAGVAKLYIDESSELLLTLGIIAVILFAIIFIFLTRTMHNKIISLRKE